MKKEQVELIREALRRFNRKAGVLKSDPYGIGLSLSQASAIVDIEKNERLKPNDLVKLLNLEKSSISRLVAVLEKLNLIKIESDPNDGRSKILTLTQSGKKSAQIINRISDQSVTDVLKKLESRELQDVLRGFEKLIQVLEAET